MSMNKSTKGPPPINYSTNPSHSAASALASGGTQTTLMAPQPVLAAAPPTLPPAQSISMAPQPASAAAPSTPPPTHSSTQTTWMAPQSVSAAASPTPPPAHSSTQSILMAPQPASAAAPPTPPSTHSSASNSDPLAITANEPDCSDSTTHSTLTTKPFPDAPLDTVDGHDHRDSVDSLADALDGLSINHLIQSPAAPPPAVLPPPPPSVPAFVIPTQPHRGKGKYYSVVVGKCCGVYNSWSVVHPLVVGVSGSLYTVFRSYEGAEWDYYTAKAAGNVRAVREPGDEHKYGPLSEACM